MPVPGNAERLLQRAAVQVLARNCGRQERRQYTTAAVYRSGTTTVRVGNRLPRVDIPYTKAECAFPRRGD